MYVDQVARSLKTTSCLLLTPSAKSCDVACFLTVHFQSRGTWLHSVNTQPLFWPNYKCPFWLSNDQALSSRPHDSWSLPKSLCSEKIWYVSILLVHEHWQNQKQAYSRCIASHLGHFCKGQICSTESFSGPIQTNELSPIIHNKNSFIVNSFFRRFIEDDGRNYTEKYAFSYKNPLMWIKPQICEIGKSMQLMKSLKKTECFD